VSSDDEPPASPRAKRPRGGLPTGGRSRARSDGEPTGPETI